MHKLLRCFLAISLVFFLNLAQADDEFTNPSKPIYLDSTTQTVVIKLKSNPTTGYSWYLQSIDSPWLKAVSHKYVAPLSQIAGASGYELWTFEINADNTAVPFYSEIELIYSRPWQVNSAPTVFRVFYRPS